MLTFLYLEHPDQIQKIISDYPVGPNRWIVSDLKSKQDLQKLSIQKNNFYVDENILRISDFWGIWLRRLAPQIQILNSDFIRTYIQKISETDPQIDLKPHQISTLHYYIQQLAPLLLSSNHESLLEWFKENKYDNADHKWYKWYLKSKYTLKKILSEKMIDASWVSSYLQDLDLSKVNETTPIVLDLGTEMTSVEMGIFNRLAKKCDVFVIVPNPEWKSKYHFLLNTYKMNEGFAQKKQIESIFTAKPFESKNFLRLSTQLAEVKWITQTVRGWLDSGVKPSEIALLSPQAEKYWPALSTHFEIEGVPVDKPIVTSLISTGLFQNLISSLQSFSSSLTWEDLETSYFQNEDLETDKIQYEKFKALFIELTDVEDLGRDDKIKKIFYRKMNLNQNVDRFQFLGEILKVITKSISQSADDFDEFQNFLELIFKDFLSKTTDLQLQFSEWLDLFKSMLARKEIKIKNPYAEGVQIRDLGAVYLNQITHRIWFGLDDSPFQSTSKNLIPLKDVEVLKNIFDFPLQYPEESHDEFNLRWLSRSKCTEQFFTCAHINLSGEPLNTALFILENNAEPDYLFHPQTRLDQIQWAQSDENSNTKIILEKNPQPLVVSEFKPTQISGTDVIQYAQCEFKLLASRGFRLRDYSVVSIDLDPMQKGTLAHSLFEYLIKDENYKSADQKLISDFLDQKRITARLFPNDDLFWSIQKNKFIQIGLKFCANEKKRLNGQAYLHILEKEFKLNISDVEITGRIDRIDQDVHSKEYLIYDYKRTDSSHTYHVDKWLAEKEYQMLFYLLALTDETGSAENIRGAVYYFYQKLTVSKGFINAGNEKFDSSIEIKKNMNLDSVGFKNLLIEFKNVLANILGQLQQSKFSPSPIDIDLCNSCDWRRLCRAAHLN